MFKTLPILGFALFTTLAIGVAVAFTGNTEAQIGRQASADCPMTEVAVDEGYGVSRMEMRPVCTQNPN